MDTVPLVDNLIDDGQRLVDRLIEAGIDVRAACWVKPADEDRWSLYIATPLRDEKGALKAYDAVLGVFRSLGDVWIDSSDIKLVGANHRIVFDSDLSLRRSRGGVRMQFPQGRFGGLSADEAYVYPLGKVEVPIYGLTFRGDPSGLIHLSFEPHNPNSTFTVGSGPGAKTYPAQTDLDWLVAAPLGAALERDETGQMTLAWDLHGTRRHSNAHEVLSLAELGLHGFRVIRQPDHAKRTA